VVTVGQAVEKRFSNNGLIVEAGATFNALSVVLPAIHPKCPELVPPRGVEPATVFKKIDEAFPCPRRLAFSDIANLAL